MSYKYLLLVYPDVLDGEEVTCVAVFDVATGFRSTEMPSDIPELCALEGLNLHDLADGILEYCGSLDRFQLTCVLSKAGRPEGEDAGFFVAQSFSDEGIDRIASDMHEFLTGKRRPNREEDMALAETFEAAGVAERFDSPKFIERQLKLALEREDYELAAVLRDKLNGKIQ
jgi:hypothetical protein